MMTAKDMKTSELLEEDARVGNELDACSVSHKPQYLARRREIRAELNRRRDPLYQKLSLILLTGVC
jgi:hypothetical protein